MIAINENDWLLEEIVNLINGTEKELQITLVTDVVLISGEVVSSHRYLDYTYALLRSRNVIPDPEIDKSIPLEKQNISGDILEKRMNFAREKASSKREPSTPSFIHIKDVNTSGGETHSAKSVFWRGSIEKVSGFILTFKNSLA